MFKQFKYSRVALDNGLVVLSCLSPRVPLVSVSLFLRCGKAQNRFDRPGIASLTARMLDEGTEKLTSIEISQLVENIGGELTSFSEREITALTFQARREHLSIAVELLSEMVRRPTFPPDRLEIERRKVINHLLAMEDDPQLVGSRLLNGAIYGRTPLALPVLGTQEVLETVSSAELKSFHRHHYGPANATLVVAGDFSAGTLESLVWENFADWRNPDLQPQPEWPLARQQRPIKIEHPMEKEQVSVYLGHLGTTRRNPDHYALQVMDAILGGGPGFTSRIPRRLRDDEGLAYVTYADIAGSSGLYPGRFVAFIGTSPAHRCRVVDELISEIESLSRRGVSDEELALAKDYLTGNFVFEFQSNSSVCKSLFSIELFGLEEDFVQAYPRHVAGVGLDEVQRVARQYLDTINYTTVFVGSI